MAIYSQCLERVICRTSCFVELIAPKLVFLIQYMYSAKYLVKSATMAPQMTHEFRVDENVVIDTHILVHGWYSDTLLWLMCGFPEHDTSSSLGSLAPLYVLLMAGWWPVARRTLREANSHRAACLVTVGEETVISIPQTPSPFPPDPFDLHFISQFQADLPDLCWDLQPTNPIDL